MDGRNIWFASKANKELFDKKPHQYYTAYGGWCAIAMVDESFVISDYTLYKIQDGKLLFFSIRAFFNGLTQWEKDTTGNLIKADANYRKYFE